MVAELAIDEEPKWMDALVHEVQRAFLQVPAQQVEVVIEEHWRAFQGAAVRDFVPLLVRRRALSHLRTLGGPAA